MPRTIGQIKLLRCCNRTSQAQVRRSIGASKAAMSYWISGQRKPDYENRKILKKELNINMDDWDIESDGSKI